MNLNKEFLKEEIKTAKAYLKKVFAIHSNLGN